MQCIMGSTILIMGRGRLGLWKSRACLSLNICVKKRSDLLRKVGPFFHVHLWCFSHGAFGLACYLGRCQFIQDISQLFSKDNFTTFTIGQTEATKCSEMLKTIGSFCEGLKNI